MLDAMEKDAQRLSKLLMLFTNENSSPLGRLAGFYAKLFIRLRPNELHPIPFMCMDIIDKGEFALFHGAPTVIFILEDTRGAGKPELDCGVCGQNIVLAAHSLGLGTCWVGLVELLNYGIKWRRKLGASFPYRLVEGIAVGYPVAEPDGMVARELHEIVWYESGQKKTVY